MRHLLPAAICGVCVTWWTGCAEKGPSDGPQDRPVIAVIPKGTMHVFWKTVQAGALKAGEELNVEIIWKGPLREDDREDQIKVVDDMITRGVTGIVLAPLDDTALQMPVREATRTGIPVVIIDSDLKGDDYVSFVATDNYKGGQLAARHLAQLLDGKGKVAMLRFMEGSGSTTNREMGFLEVMEEFPEIEVVVSNQYAGATAESAYQASENLLSRFKAPDGALTINGIFASNESGAFGMLRALQDGGFAGKVRYVDFDAAEKQNEALRNGEIDALIVQKPMHMAYTGVEMLVKHLRGEDVPKRIDTGAVLATRQNMDDPEIHELLYPDEEKWLPK